MIFPPDKKIVANAVGGKTARACDFCMRKRARWYCAADDAFLCQPCDSSVHSANPLARRHQRVRLKTASFKRHHAPGGGSAAAGSNYLVPSWHRGLTRRSRTPRHGKPQLYLDCPTSNTGAKMAELIGGSTNSLLNPPSPFVPEAGADGDEDLLSREEDECDEQLLYRVPVLDPVAARFFAVTTVEGSAANDGRVATDLVRMNIGASSSSSSDDQQQQQQLDHIIDYNNSSGLLLSLCDDDAVQMDALVADVETLLGRGLDGKSYGGDLKGGVVDKDSNSGKRVVVKVEHHQDVFGSRVLEAAAAEMDVGSEPFELNFDYGDDDSPTACEEEDVKVAVAVVQGREMKVRKVLLTLDYEAVSAAWASSGCPWMNGERPLINPDESWPHCLGGCGPDGSHNQAYLGRRMAGDGGREARVSRYREKRRTRLFSKKIRYEVRKLNAEKRPRMKGRFVKRSSYPIPAAAAVAATSFPLMATK